MSRTCTVAPLPRVKAPPTWSLPQRAVATIRSGAVTCSKSVPLCCAGLWVDGADTHVCPPARIANVENVWPRFSTLGETMRTVTEAGRRAAIDQALRGEWQRSWSARPCWLSAAKTTKRRRPRGGWAGRLRGTLNQRWGARNIEREGIENVGRQGKKARSEKSAWSIAHIHPSLCFFFLSIVPGAKENTRTEH